MSIQNIKIVMFCHHQPSNEDIEATKRLYDVGELIGIDLLDHIIFTDDSFTSLKESGHL